MKYMIILQDDNAIGMCFGQVKFWLHDGDVSIGSINSQGQMLEIHYGQLVKGKFGPRDKV